MESLEEAPKYKTWIDALNRHGCVIHSIENLNVIHKSNGEVLFAFVHTKIEDEAHHPLVPVAVLRGPAVIIVPIIEVKETHEKMLLIVKQRRIADGAIHVEFPAGMLDHDIDDPKKIAVKEVFEETGLRIQESDLMALHDKALFSSPGLLDEKVYFYAFQKILSFEQIKKIDGKSTGNSLEKEKISTTLISFKEAKEQMTAVSSILALFFCQFLDLDRSA